MTALVIIMYNSTGVFEYGAGEVIINGAQVEGATLTVLTIAIFLFAVSTMISWSYYGSQAWMYLFGKSKAADITYKIIFCLFIVIGASSSMEAVWGFSDAMILGLVFPNMIGLFFLFPRVKEELNKYIAVISKKS